MATALLEFLRSEREGVLFLSWDGEKERLSARLYESPAKVIRFMTKDDPAERFSEIQSALLENRHAAGFFSYELGYALNGLEPPHSEAPLGWIGIFDPPTSFDDLSLSALKKDLNPIMTDYWIKGITPHETKTGYEKKIKQIHERIRAGETYQVNHTFPLGFEFYGALAGFFLDLFERQKTPYAAFLRFDEMVILSLSPELFFEREDGRIMVRPMKGTAPRFEDPEQDAHSRRELETSTKNRAENLMIVDLLRNDLGRVCETGSVAVTRLFTIEPYKTLFQMTSTVEGRPKKDASWFEVFRALFPSGSVTGAPKIQTMKIIRELEETERGVYTGALGWIAPTNNARFSIPIRTAVVTPKDRTGLLGIGSGIVIDSEPETEYSECLLKGRFLTELEAEYQLIETLRWENEFLYLEEHMERLDESARFFRIPLDEKVIQKALIRRAEEYAADSPLRVRLLVDKMGEFTITEAPLPQKEIEELLRTAIAPTTIDPANIFLSHKTTNRAFYNAAREEAERSGLYDLIFLNTRGEVTEGSFNNVFLERGGELLTPPVVCGLLNGTLRRRLMKEKKCKEAVIRADALKTGRLYLGNSVRGLVPVRLEETP